MSELGIFHHPTLAATQTALQQDASHHGNALATALTNSLERFSSKHHGDFGRWQQALRDLPELSVDHISLPDCVTMGGACNVEQHDALHAALQQFKPWRKGPFQLFEVAIDTEWRSDWKWQRLAPTLAPTPDALAGSRILDVGCGNGYFGWQLRAAGAASVVGIDPTLLFCMQHLAINHYLQDDHNWVLPLKLEELPALESSAHGFDGVLSMGVLYHRRDPMAHVQQLFELVKPGGWLVLESLIVEGAQSIYPATDGGRYARMRNVWCVPSVAAMQAWLEEVGFSDCQVLDDSVTSLTEQRATDWMTFESLEQALDPNDQSATVEGWPRPRRAMLLARRGLAARD
ncbi:MAG: tRNA 5-methoxyuridine(34)/uridine 5-oxyacetic acid(34) synthase CmoB [Pseudomonadales bacterium]